MDWEFVSVSSVAEAASGNLTLNAPAGAAKGDLLIACIGYRSNAAFTPPGSGVWNLVATQQSSGDTDATSGIASGGMWYHVRGDTNPSFAFTRTAGDVAEGFVLCYRNCKAAPYDTGGAATLGSLGEPSLASISTAEANELLVAMVVSGDQNTVDTFDAATAPSVASGTTADTSTEPTANTWILRVVMSDNTGADIGVAIADGVKTGTGATGTFSAIDQTGTTRSVFIVGAFKQLPTVLPNVYDSVTVADPAEGITLFITQADLAINVYDEVNAEEYLPEQDNENLGPVDTYDELEVAEDTDRALSLAGIDIYDSVTLSEDILTIFDLAVDSYDTITVVEDASGAVSAVTISIEDIEVFLSTAVYPDADLVTVSESSILSLALADVSVSESSSVSEFAQVTLSDLVIDTFDLATLGETVVSEVSGLDISVYTSSIVQEEIIVSPLGVSADILDQIAISEYLVASVSDLDAIVFDQTTISDVPEITLLGAVEDIQISGIDTVGILEDIVITVSGLAISTFESVVINEYVNDVLSDSQINTFDTTLLTEYVTIENTDLGTVTISETVTIAELITLSLGDIVVGQTELVTVSEEVSLAVQLSGIDVFSAITIVDTPSVSISAGVVHLSIPDVYETTSVSEANSILLSVEMSIFDITGIVEDISISFASTSFVTDDISISENLTIALSDLGLSVSETISVVDSVSPVAQLFINVSEEIGLAEVIYAQHEYLISIVDSTLVSESISVLSYFDFLNISTFDLVSILEQIVSTGGDHSINVNDATRLSEISVASWVVAKGLLSIIADEMFPSIEVVGLTNSIEVFELQHGIEALGMSPCIEATEMSIEVEATAL